MNAKLIASSFIITANVTKEELEKLIHANSEALVVYEGEGEERKPVFVAGANFGGVPQLNDSCIVFNTTLHDGSNFVAADITLRGDLGENPMDILCEHYGKALRRVKAFEQQVPAALTQLAIERIETEALITIA